MERLKRRTDFRAAARAARAPAGAFVVQARQRDESGDAGGPVRVGFTVSRQVGNAVERNRVRRRLREMIRLAPNTKLCATLRAGHDYVLIGRRAALQAPFPDMVRQFDAALRRIHAAPRSGQDSSAAAGGGKDAPLHRAGSSHEPRGGQPPKHGPRGARRKDTSKST